MTIHGTTSAVQSMPSDDANAATSWDPVAQIYTGGTVPGCDDAELLAILDPFYVFGYGSLCWNPSGTLQTVVSRGRAPDHVRVWAQKSTDHRGRPGRPGIVCTLLTRDEYAMVMGKNVDGTGQGEVPTEASKRGVTGLIYAVPKYRIQECLQELDFREKGGYAREIVSVVREDTGETVSCLLYRGTVDNPAFWPRAARDVTFAASVMAVAEGPSGDNHVYLHQLAQFLRETDSNDGDDDDATLVLDDLVRKFRGSSRRIHFIASCGSNQHGQLAIPKREGRCEDAHSWTEATLHLLSNDRSGTNIIQNVYAGGGHSAVLTENGQLFLWGWNEHGQALSDATTSNECVVCMEPLPGVRVADVALGFAHTLIVEWGTKRLFAFGDNRMGQVAGKRAKDKHIEDLSTPHALANEKIVHCAAGLFHSAVVSDEGVVWVYGGSYEDGAQYSIPDGRFVQVACGARDLILALDNQGRLWSLGKCNNKYGQCGHPGNHESPISRVAFPLQSSRCLDVQCGWSHVLALVEDDPTNRETVSLYGWGRNDLGQLGTGSTEHQPLPIKLPPKSPSSVHCGSESSFVTLSNGEVLSCGWNEHGNLGTGDPTEEESTFSWKHTTRLDAPPMLPASWESNKQKSESAMPRPSSPGGDKLQHCGANGRLKIAAGGAHVLALRVTDDK